MIFLFSGRMVGCVMGGAMRAERKRANAASYCAYPQMVTGFYQWSCLTEARGTRHSHFVSTLSEVRSLLIAFFLMMLVVVLELCASIYMYGGLRVLLKKGSTGYIK